MTSPRPEGAPTLDGMELIKQGYLEKYSVGRGMLAIKNWQRRWFSVDHRGLSYAKAPHTEPRRGTNVPFVARDPAGQVTMYPVFVYSTVNAGIHPEAKDEHMFYFALRFDEAGEARVLLVRTPAKAERDAWVRFISQFVHSASMSAGGPQHPLVAKRVLHDPSRLDPREQHALRATIGNWDEGVQYRTRPSDDGTDVPSIDDCIVHGSDDDASGSPSRASSLRASRVVSRAASPGASPAAGGVSPSKPARITAMLSTDVGPAPEDFDAL
jgi:hypothetical protein